MSLTAFDLASQTRVSISCDGNLYGSIVENVEWFSKTLNCDSIRGQEENKNSFPCHPIEQYLLWRCRPLHFTKTFEPNSIIDWRFFCAHMRQIALQTLDVLIVFRCSERSIHDFRFMHSTITYYTLNEKTIR